MPPLQWTSSDAVFLTEIDDEHREIFEAISLLREALADGPASEIVSRSNRLASAVTMHFAHEERLMRAARYSSTRWHKQLHDAARRRVKRFTAGIAQADPEAPWALIDYLASWLHNHTSIADRMLGAALRNHQRSLARLTMKASTRPVDSCTWVDQNGDPFEPRS